MVATDPTGWTSHTDDFHRGMTWKLAVRAATTASITIATALNAGDVLDGVTLATGDRVLVKDQATGSQNGIYIVSASPARAPDMDQDSTTAVPAQEVLGAVVIVFSGTVNAGTMWRNTNTTAPTLGTTALTFSQIGGVSAGAVTTSGLTMATARLLGRTTASTGAIEEITVGSGLSLAAGSLTTTGSGTGTVTTVEEVDGSPTDSAVTKIVFPNGTLAIASHVATYTPAAGGSSDAILGQSGVGGATISGLQGSADIDVAGTNDDEFNTTDTSDPMTGWTTLGTPTSHNINSTAKSHYYVKQNAGGVGLVGIYKSFSPTFTITAKLTADNVYDSSQGRAGIFVAEASPGKIETVGRYTVSGGVPVGVGVDAWTNRTTFSSTPANILMQTGRDLYLQIIATSSSNVTYKFSYNGLIWIVLSSARNPGFTIGSAGLMIDPNASGVAIEALFDWVRFT